MLSFAKNERGIRLASAAIILLPVVCLIFTMSRSHTLNLIVFASYLIFAAMAGIAFMYERAEEEEQNK